MGWPGSTVVAVPFIGDAGCPKLLLSVAEGTVRAAGSGLKVQVTKSVWFENRVGESDRAAPSYIRLDAHRGFPVFLKSGTCSDI